MRETGGRDDSKTLRLIPLQVGERGESSVDDLYTGCLDHLRPFLPHSRNERGEFSRTGELRTAAQLFDPSRQLRTGEPRVDHAVEPGDELGRRAGWRDHP